MSGQLEIQVPRYQQRRAQLEIRFTAVELKPPARKKHRKPLTVWAILAQEINPPANFKEPLEWAALNHYRRLSSNPQTGCKIEECQFDHADRLEACLVMAWRILYLTKPGREVPEVPCTDFLKTPNGKP
ncbi:hypothetical protein JW964_17310 [candidate division KSB1 bacterium]|nr:hypothetical protein [candidate division KSB1 bacterium]